MAGQRKRHNLSFTFYLLVAIYVATGHTKVIPPNFNFSLDQLKPFYPESSLGELKKTHKLLLVSKTEEFQWYKTQLTHQRFSFDILVQAKGDTITDFFAKLPSYFLHDVFLQSLVNRYQKQSYYRRVSEQAFYQWKNAQGLQLSYGASCTIQCFPIFLAAESQEKKWGEEYKSIARRISSQGKDRP